MKFLILTVGKLKERYWKDAAAEYVKRLSPYVSLEIAEVADEKTPDGASAAQNGQILRKEGERLMARIPSDAFCVALAIQGKGFSSEEFALKLEHFRNSGCKTVVFVIGGSLGLSDEVLERADLLLSFSRMTFPHQMMRVILLEQIYRGFRILNHEPYHK